MTRKMLLSIILILGMVLLASCSALGLSTSTAGQGSQNGGNSGAGGTPGARRFGGTPNPLRLTQRAEGTTFPGGGGGFAGTPNPLRLTQLAEGTTFPGGGQGGFGQGQGSPTATFPPLPTATATLPVTPPRPASLVGLLSPGDTPMISGIHMFSTKEGWAIGTGTTTTDTNDHVLRTQDGGTTWIDVTPSEPFDPSMALRKQATSFFLDAGHAWVTYQYMGGPSTVTTPLVWFTADGGQTWATGAPLDVGQGGDFYLPGVMQFIDALHGWLLVHVGNGMSHDYVFLYSTADGGKTWKRIVDPWVDNLDMSCTKTGMSFADTNTGLVTGDCNGVVPNSIYLYRTTDGGTTWNKIRLPIPAKLPDIYSNESNVCGSYNPGFQGQTGWVVVKCNTYDPGVTQTFLYTSPDGGKTWSSHTVPAILDYVQFLNPGVGWFAGGGRVYLSEDGGKTWSPVSGLGGEGQPDFITQTAGWMIAKTGDSITLVQTADGGATWTQLKPVVK